MRRQAKQRRRRLRSPSRRADVARPAGAVLPQRRTRQPRLKAAPQRGAASQPELGSSQL